MKFSGKKYLDPSFFIEKLTDYTGQPIDVGMQMDVDEFLISFMDKLERQLIKVGNEEFLELCFKGSFYQEINGIDCNHKTNKNDNFIILSISIQDVSNLRTGLQNMIEWETLQNINAYDCEKCRVKVSAKKRVTFEHLPNFLFISLKRFKYDRNQQ